MVWVMKIKFFNFFVPLKNKYEQPNENGINYAIINENE